MKAQSLREVPGWSRTDRPERYWRALAQGRVARVRDASVRSGRY